MKTIYDLGSSTVCSYNATYLHKEEKHSPSNKHTNILQPLNAIICSPRITNRSINQALDIQNAKSPNIPVARSSRKEKIRFYSAIRESDDENGDDSDSGSCTLSDKIESQNAILKIKNFTLSDFHVLYIKVKAFTSR